MYSVAIHKHDLQWQVKEITMDANDRSGLNNQTNPNEYAAPLPPADTTAPGSSLSVTDQFAEQAQAQGTTTAPAPAVVTPAVQSQDAPLVEQPTTLGQPAAPTGLTEGAHPGKTVGLVGFILSLVSVLTNFLLLGIPAVISFIVSLVGLLQSKKAGMKNGLALAGVIISSIVAVLTIVAYVVVGYFGVAAYAELTKACKELGPGVHQTTISGSEATVTCNAENMPVDAQ